MSEAARLRYRSAGDFTAPLTIRMPTGGGIFGGQTHSQSPEALFTHVSGLKTVVPSNPYDAKGLLIASIEDDDPVIFLEPKRLYNGPFDGYHDRPIVPWSQHPLSEVPEGHYTVPLGSARVRRPGSAVTVLTYGTMVHVAARGRGGDRGSTPRSSTCARSCRSTSTRSSRRSRRPGGASWCTRRRSRRASAPSSCALVQEHAFYSLEAPIARVTGWDTPVPARARVVYFPGPDRVAAAFARVLGGLT